jgi:hypothetical protein
MDTRFWGPSGWQFYHTIAYAYPDVPDEKIRERYELFFGSMKEVLPCKFCRASTAQFMSEEPPRFESKRALTKWLYDLHNKVNTKLRGQCKEDPKVICPPPEPSLEAVDDVYHTLLKLEPTSVLGLDFLFCLAYNYGANPARHAYLNTFGMLHSIYPFKDLRKMIDILKQESLIDRNTFFKWWYTNAKRLCKETGCELGSLRGTLQKYGRYKSGCNRGKTCRNGQKVRDHRKTFKITHDRLLRI